MTLWYTSDSHFDHANIIKYANRPFSSVEEMNETLIDRWNEVVKPSDHIWHLGDLTMHRQIEQIKYRILDRLNGHKRLILGNHDADKVENYLKYFEKIQASHVHERMLFTHIPVHPRSVGRFKAIVHGHTHEVCFDPAQREVYKDTWDGKDPVEPGTTPYINICVEVTNYRPVNLDELLEKTR